LVDSSEFVPLVVLVLGSNEESRLWNECHAFACKILRKDGSECPSAAIAAANGQIAEALARSDGWEFEPNTERRKGDSAVQRSLSAMRRHSKKLNSRRA
jgi:hypothetical protein